jgi:hypothetical protein
MMNKNGETVALAREICAEAAGPWREQLTASVPGAAASPAPGKADPFSNVRGFIINETVDRIIEGLITGCGRDRMKEAMVTWMKLQALETDSPEEASAILRLLKSIVREHAPAGGPRSDAARFLEASLDEWIDVASELYRETRALLPDLMLREKRRTEIRNLKNERRREAPR